MSTTINVALVPRGVKVDMSDVANVAAALSIQIARDFSPIWGISATVAAFTTARKVPLGYWPIYIEDPSKMPQGAGGVHLDHNNQPYALIETGDQWSIDASHECLEMLVDPSGNKVQANPLLDQAVALGQPQHQVEYIVEVCDPIEDAQYAYQINGVLVSDFITPHFYDPAAAAGVQYDFGSFITAPRQVLTNGYISWLDPVSNEAMQLTNFADQNGNLDPQIVDLGADARFQAARKNGGALRPAVDCATAFRRPDYRAGLTAEHRARIATRYHAVQRAADAHAGRMEEDIEIMLRRHSERI